MVVFKFTFKPFCHIRLTNERGRDAAVAKQCSTSAVVATTPCASQSTAPVAIHRRQPFPRLAVAATPPCACTGRSRTSVDSVNAASSSSFARNDASFSVFNSAV
jgi:hypothetical protein